MHPFLAFTLQGNSNAAPPGFVPHSGGFLPSTEMIQAVRTTAYPSWGPPTSQNKDTTCWDTCPFSSLRQNASTRLHHSVAVGRPITTQWKFTVSDSNGRRNGLIIILRNQKEKHLIRDLQKRILTTARYVSSNFWFRRHQKKLCPHSPFSLPICSFLSVDMGHTVPLI